MEHLDMDTIIMELIVNAGNARSLSIEAIRAAREGDYEKADSLLAECDQAMNDAHNVQTELIQQELNGEKQPLSLLAVHAQDHVMNAMTVRDLALEIIAMSKELRKLAQ